MDRLIDAVLAGGVDVLAFTSAPAAASLLRRADERGVRDDLLRLLRGTRARAVRGSGHRAAAGGLGRADGAAATAPGWGRWCGVLRG